MNNFYFYLSKILAPWLIPSNILFLTLFLLYIFTIKYKKKNIILFFRINIFLIFLLLFLPIGNYGLIFLEKNYKIQKTFNDVKNIVVLAGSEDLTSTIKTDKIHFNEGSERLIETIILSNKYPNSKIFYVGGDGNIIKNDISEVELAIKFFKELNLNQQRIEYVGNSRNTYENIKEIKKLGLNENKTLLVTSAFHMKRSMIIAKKINLNVIPYAVDFRSFSHKSIINQYQEFNVIRNLAKFNLFIREIIGIIAFKVLI